MMNLSMEHHGQQLGFLRDADRVVFVREEAGSASDTVTTVILYQSYTS